MDLVVCNPPYVDAAELEGLPPEVLADPRLALVGGPHIHERVAAAALPWLRGGGVLALEIGADQGVEVSRALGRSFADVRTERDLAGRDRVVIGRAP